MQKGVGVIYILVGVLILAAIGGAYYLGKSSTPKPSTPVVSQTPKPTPSSTLDTNPAPTGAGETVYTESDRSANWKTYTNTKYGFSFKYPIGAREGSQPRSAFPTIPRMLFFLRSMIN